MTERLLTDTCANCGKLIARERASTARPEKGWFHTGRPEQGSYWCNPYRKSRDPQGEPQGFPASLAAGRR